MSSLVTAASHQFSGYSLSSHVNLPPSAMRTSDTTSVPFRRITMVQRNLHCSPNIDWKPEKLSSNGIAVPASKGDTFAMPFQYLDPTK